MLGETRTYSFEAITTAIRLIARGARFIATNPDVTGPSPDGPLPATGSVAALITKATGVAPYFVGKPNPLMMRSALNRIEAHSETTVMVGDRMDTDIVSGLEAGLRSDPGADRFDPAGGGRAVPLPPDPDRRRRSPTWSTWSDPTLTPGRQLRRADVGFGAPAGRVCGPLRPAESAVSPEGARERVGAGRWLDAVGP